jgi:hypothetical protein
MRNPTELPAARRAGTRLAARRAAGQADKPAQRLREAGHCTSGRFGTTPWQKRSANQQRSGCALRATGDECYGSSPLLKGTKGRKSPWRERSFFPQLLPSPFWDQRLYWHRPSSPHRCSPMSRASSLPITHPERATLADSRAPTSHLWAGRKRYVRARSSPVADLPIAGR